MPGTSARQLERDVRRAFVKWAAYRGFYVCAACGYRRECGRRRRGQAPWLCIDCWDVLR